MNEQKPDSQWHLDKRAPIAPIFMILSQTAGMAWWGSNLTEQLNER